MLNVAVRHLAVARVAFGGRVPEVGTVDVPVVEPRRNVVWVVGALAGDLLEREAAGEDVAAGGAQRGEEGLLLVGPEDVGRERLAIDKDIDLFLVGLFDELDLGGVGAGSGQNQGEEGEGLLHGLF